MSKENSELIKESHEISANLSFWAPAISWEVAELLAKHLHISLTDPCQNIPASTFNKLITLRRKYGESNVVSALKAYIKCNANRTNHMLFGVPGFQKHWKGFEDCIELWKKAEDDKKAKLQNETTREEAETQMEPYPVNPEPIHVFTVEDIEDIGKRASCIAKIYGFSLNEALTAATKLKAEEIRRNLSPLLEPLEVE